MRHYHTITNGAIEGAANHVRLAPTHAERATHIFVYGKGGKRFPARQSLNASHAVARLNALSPGQAFFIEQSTQALDAGAFHNDVVWRWQ